VEDLFLRQARELDRKRREEMLHQIQRILHERVVFAPIWENGFIRGVGPRAEEPALSLIPAFPYAAPWRICGSRSSGRPSAAGPDRVGILGRVLETAAGDRHAGPAAGRRDDPGGARAHSRPRVGGP